MRKGTRIRWQNVAKLAAGVAACIALVAGLPALLKRPKPPPLPADVGLTHVADSSPAVAMSATRPTRQRPRSRHAGDAHEHRPQPHHEPDRPETRPHHPRPQHDQAGGPSAPEPIPVATATPASPPSTTPAPAPAPAPTHSSPPPSAPAPSPATTSSSPAPAEPQPSGGGGGEPSGPSEFGFEH